jgi:hypothetical protein
VGLGRDHPRPLRLRPAPLGHLLLGGDKRGRWNEWYAEMIPVADRLYDEHLTEFEMEEGRR